MSSPILAELVVAIQQEIAGTVRQHENGTLSFAYLPAYQGTPLSLSMPLSNQEYGDKIVRPYLFGLIPDNYYLRRALGREFGVSADNPFALLAHIGMDCPGAVQFFPSDSSTQALGATSPSPSKPSVTAFAPSRATNRLPGNHPRSIGRSGASSRKSPSRTSMANGLAARVRRPPPILSNRAFQPSPIRRSTSTSAYALQHSAAFQRPNRHFKCSTGQALLS